MMEPQAEVTGREIAWGLDKIITGIVGGVIVGFIAGFMVCFFVNATLPPHPVAQPPPAKATPATAWSSFAPVQETNLAVPEVPVQLPATVDKPATKTAE
jgi:hypothetical protein